MKRGEYLRAYARGDKSSLPLHVRVLAMPMTAWEMEYQCIWHVHSAAGHRSGLCHELVDDLRGRRGYPNYCRRRRLW